jgi:hypothetical protein
MVSIGWSLYERANLGMGEEKGARFVGLCRSWYRGASGMRLRRRGDELQPTLRCGRGYLSLIGRMIGRWRRGGDGVVAPLRSQ